MSCVRISLRPASDGTVSKTERTEGMFVCGVLMLTLIETEAGVGMGELGKGIADGELCNTQDSSDKAEINVVKYVRDVGGLRSDESKAETARLASLQPKVGPEEISNRIQMTSLRYSKRQKSLTSSSRAMTP